MLKLFVEFGPLAVFLITYKYSNIFVATLLMLIVTSGCLLLSYLIDKRVSMPLLLSGAVLLLSGTITLVSGDPKYIKMKPTIVYLIFGGVLYGGVLAKRGFIKDVLGKMFNIPDQSWILLSRRFAFFFFFLAGVNEMVWRNFSEDFWVNFKVFGSIPITLVFVCMQMPFLYKNHKL